MSRRFRQPFAWEPAVPASDPPPLDMARVVLMPSGDAGAATSSIAAGEYAGVRDTRDSMVAHILEHTDGSDAARAWATEKAQRAAISWDRGVRDGSIKR